MNTTPLDEQNEFVVKIIRAFRPGDVVFLEPKKPIPQEELLRIRRALEVVLSGSDIRVVILPAGLRVVGREEQATPLPAPTEQK